MNLNPTEINLNDHGHRMARPGRRSGEASQVVIERNPCDDKFNIGTWNVRTMLKPGKIEEISYQIKETMSVQWFAL